MSASSAALVGGCIPPSSGRLFEPTPNRAGIVLGGSGPVVVISYEDGGSLCTWQPLAERLAAAGLRPVLFERSSRAKAMDDIVTVVDKVGQGQIALVGGSLGGRMSIAAASRLPTHPSAVVDISGGNETTPADAGELTSPLLLIGSTDDSSTPMARLRDIEEAATSAASVTVREVPGDAHASAIFDGPSGTSVLDEIVAFLQEHTTKD